MAGCRAPMLLVDVSPWLVPVSFWLVLLSFLVPGGCVPVAGAGILQAGVVVLPGGWWMCPRGWWCLLASSPAYCSRAPRTGVQPDSSARRALAVEIQVSKE